jgi:Spy/CpxP family protein refolding chaperone
MKGNFPRLIIALLAGLTLMAGVVHAQEDDSILDKLKLTPTQREQIKTLNDKFRTRSAPLRTDIARLLDEEKKLKAASSPDLAALKAKMQERADKEIELALELTRYREGLEAILTPEQVQLLRTLTAAKNERKK